MIAPLGPNICHKFNLISVLTGWAHDQFSI